MLNYNLLTNSEDIDAALEYLISKNTPICIDTETDGLSRFRKVIGIGLSADETESFYIPLLIWKDNELIAPWENPELIVNKFKKFFSSDIKWIGHNITFDAIAIENLTGVNITPNIHCDTQSLAHLVYNEEGPLGLKPLSSELFNLKAEESQDEVKESVKRNGGKTAKGELELYKADWDIIGRYCCYDCHFTYRVYKKLYPEIEKQGFSEIWHKEVLPLSQVTYELNREGFCVDIEYFKNLKTEVEQKIKELEIEIMDKISPQIQEYVSTKIKEEVKVTPRSVLGRQLLKEGLAKIVEKELRITNEVAAFELMKTQYASKKPLFNLDSGEDKAYLIYDVLGLPCEKTTESGKRATDAKTIEALCQQYENESEVLKILMQRAKERKILSTYIEPILENAVDGKIYTSFRQTGTISGRYSSSDPINFQNLPRDDKRIKKGFVPKEGNVIIGSDYESAEPKAFAYVSGEQKIKDIFIHNLDFYSKIMIDVEDLKEVSADPNATNFMKKVLPEKRQIGKTVCLSIPYGAKSGRIANLLKIEYAEAQDLIDRYLGAYPKLQKWMETSEKDAMRLGYVKTIFGRKRRSHTVHDLWKKYGITDFSKRAIERLVNQYRLNEDYLQLYLKCNNNLNNAKNFQIQGICASIINKAMLEFQEKRKTAGCENAKLIMMVHDEIILTAPKEEAEAAAKLLKECMEDNEFAKRIDVKMKADPIITDKNLSEAK